MVLRTSRRSQHRRASMVWSSSMVWSVTSGSSTSGHRCSAVVVPEGRRASTSNSMPMPGAPKRRRRLRAPPSASIPPRSGSLHHRSGLKRRQISFNHPDRGLLTRYEYNGENLLEQSLNPERNYNSLQNLDNLSYINSPARKSAAIGQVEWVGDKDLMDAVMGGRGPTASDRARRRGTGALRATGRQMDADAAMCSITRAPILTRRARMVANSALASGFVFGIAARTPCISQ